MKLIAWVFVMVLFAGLAGAVDRSEKTPPVPADRLKKYKGLYIHCDENVKNGEKLCWDTRFGIQERINLKNGERHGRYRKYELKYLGTDENYAGGKIEGKARYYTDDGYPTEEKTYKAGELDGESKELGSPQNRNCGEADYGKLVQMTTYRKGKKHGKAVSYRGCGGSIEEELTYVDDALDGEKRKYAESGKLEEISRFRQGKEEGVQERFFPNGNPKWVYTAKAGSRDGWSLTFFENGQFKKADCHASNDPFGDEVATCQGIPKPVARTADGKPVAAGASDKEEVRTADGKALESFALKGNKRHGPYTLSHANGKPKETGTFKEGELEGEVKQYDQDGKLTVTMVYKAGKQDGLEKRFFGSGETKAEVRWETGEAKAYKLSWQNGNPKEERVLSGDGTVKITEYYDSGTRKSEGQFRMKKEEGRYRRRPASTPLLEENFSWGLQSLGEHTSYHENGKTSAVRTFRDGEQDGATKIYFDDGKLSEEIAYAKGVVRMKKEYDRAGKLLLHDEYFEDGSRKSHIKK